jgi:plasmid stabilization system protein ParE
VEIVFLRAALKDLVWFRQYYKAVFPEGSAKARTQFTSIIQVLIDNPFIGHISTDHIDVRELHIARTPFTVIYRIKDTTIEVLRVWDDRQGL